MKPARAAAFSILVGSLVAAYMYLLGVLGDFPYVWPCTAFAFVVAGAQTFLVTTRRGPR